MGYIKETDPQHDVPAGQVGIVRAMPRPKQTDPKWSIVNKMGKMDDIHTLENKEQKDLSGITYGNQAPIHTRDSMLGAQRNIPAAYSESGLSDDPLLDEILDLIVDKDIDLEQLQLGLEEEKEHTDEPLKAAKIALDHLVEDPQYYTKLSKAMDHSEISLSSTELKEVPAMGIGISADRALTQLGPSDIGENIHADIKGELAMKRDEPVYSESDEECDEDDDLKDGCWVAAFKSGEHTDSDGATHKWDPGDIDKIAQQYNKTADPKSPERHLAPVVLGHPKDDSPAYGWIEKAKAVGNKLFVKLGQLQPEFVDALKRGLYKTRSISLYPDLNIRHIGFLGGAVPAVKGLGPFKFADDNKFETYEFSQGVDVDVNELKMENNFFKRLFDRFKVEVKSFKEGTSPDLQTAETLHKTVETIDNKFPKGATMATETKPGEIQPKDHCRYASEYLSKMKSFLDAAAVTGVSGTDISSHKEKAEEFARLAMHHLSAAHADQPTLDSANVAYVAKDLSKMHGHMAEAYDKVTVSGNLKPGDPGNVANHEEAKEPAKEESKDHVEAVGTAGTKEVPIAALKDDKDKVAELTAEISKLKDEISKLAAENEKIKNAQADKQKSDALGSYKEFCDKLVSEGRMRPADVDQTIINMQARMAMDKVNNFSEADESKSFLNQYKSYLSAMPKVVEFSELITGKVPENKPASNFVEEEIQKLMKSEPKLAYHEALNRVGKDHPGKVREYIESGYQS